MRLGVLGPLLVLDDAGQPVPVPAPRLRTLLAALLLHAGAPVSVESLADLVWDGKPPAGAAGTLRTYVRRLRTALGPELAERIVTRAPGYLCQVDEPEVDVLRFEALCRETEAAVHEQQWSRAFESAEAAVALWRGAPLLDVPSEALRDEFGPRFEQLRVQVLENQAVAALALGRAEQWVQPLRELVAAYPLRERLHAQLMRALAGSGRRAEALDAYRRVHRALADQLGIEPGPELRDLHQRILAGDDEQPTPADGPGQAPAFVVPQQLPAAARHFTGRTTELDTLVDLLSSADQVAETVVISAIDGMAGIGKTALAVHAAHQLADRFGDGVLFTDLHGFTPDTEPTTPEQALDRLLRGLGVPGPGIPPDLETRVGLYRSVLARRRVLIVLDNAADETQLTPLLPAGAGCAAIVTSRRHLAALDDATHLTLPVLDTTEAVALFRSLVGDRAVPADQPTIERLVELCGRLPLAIRITAARLRLAPAATPATLCAELDRALDAGRGLEWLSDGHRAVTAALAVSVRHLTPDQEHALRLAGLHPGRDLEPYALAALADTTLDQATRLLEDLHSASLLDQPAHRRYTMHDLTAAYARRLAAELPEPDRQTALDRLYDHYAATSTRAMELTCPWEADHRPTPPASHTPAPDLVDAAQGWLDSETDNLLAAAHHAACGHRPDHTLHQSVTLHWHLRGRGYYRQAVLLHQQAVRHAQDADNPAAAPDALNNLGHIHRLQGRYEPATDCFEEALGLARKAGHDIGEQDALTGLGHIHRVRGGYGQATECFEQALDLARRTGNRVGEQDALTGLGHIHFAQGPYGPATECLEQALGLARETGHHVGELYALYGLGRMYLARGQYGQATDCYEQALSLARRTGHRRGEQDALRGLGQVHYTRGEYGSATDCYEQALNLTRQTGDRNGEVYALRGLGYVHYARGQYAPAGDHYEHALALARQTGNRYGQFESEQGLGRVHHATGHHADAVRHHQAALNLAADLDQPSDQARAHDGLARAHLAMGNAKQARHDWQAALDLLTSMRADHTEDPEVTTTAIRAHLDTLEP